MDLMTIGVFADRTRLSPKALRLYEQLGLLSPVRVDPTNGYRFYSEDQVVEARLIALLRRLDMPLATIADVLTRASQQPEQAAEVVGRYWAGVESVTSERRVLVSYVQAKLKGDHMPTYDIQTRRLPSRQLLTISRHLYAHQTDAFFSDAFARLRSAAPGIEGIAGCPFLVFYGEVSEDSDGPMELCRPVAPETTADRVETLADLQLRVDPDHDEAFVRLAMKEMGWPALLPAVDALEAWVNGQQRRPTGALRQNLIADQRTATPDTPVCDLSVPLA